MREEKKRVEIVKNWQFERVDIYENGEFVETFVKVKKLKMETYHDSYDGSILEEICEDLGVNHAY